MHLLLLLVSLGFYPATPALAAQVTPVVFSTSTAEDIITAYAVKYGIPAAPLVATLKCESNFNGDARGDYTSNGSPTSFGVAQIHLPAHPDISQQQALNPLFSIDYAAREFAAGRATEWTCYKKVVVQ